MWEESGSCTDSRCSLPFRSDHRALLYESPAQLSCGISEVSGLRMAIRPSEFEILGGVHLGHMEVHVRNFETRDHDTYRRSARTSFPVFRQDIVSIVETPPIYLGGSHGNRFGF